MSRTWSKEYPTRAAVEAAARNHTWIGDVGQLTVPALLRQDGRQLVFAHVPGRHVTPGDLAAVASCLARFHAAAHQHLVGARMNEAHRTSRGTVLAGFAEHRERCLLELLAAPARPDTWLTAELAREWIAHAADLPAVVYKDANVRNFLLTSTVVAVDFDTVTLAPLGYDLAKLVVSATMTYGPLDTDRVTSCLHKYNELLSETGLGTCTSEQFSAWAEMHHVLTSPYLGRNGYRFSGRIVM